MNIRWPRITGFGPSAWNVDDQPWDAFARPRYKTEDEPPVLHPGPRAEKKRTRMPSHRNH